MAAALVTAEVPQAPPVKAVKLALWRHLHAPNALIEKLRAGQLAFGLIDARTVLSMRHLLAAVFRALNDDSNGRLKTRNVHSEVLLALNSNNNITEAYRKFGVQPATTQLLTIKIGTDDDDAVLREFRAAVQAELVALTDDSLAEGADVAAIRKLYKLDAKPPTAAAAPDAQQALTELEASIIESIALRGAI